MSLLAHRRAIHIWLLGFVAFFLICGAWAAAAPYDATPDEFLHVLRAAGVAQGQVFQHPAVNRLDRRETGAYQTVPTGLAPIKAREINPFWSWCFKGIPARSAACAPKLGTGGSTPRTVFTSAGRYNPLYYAAVGEPLVRAPDWTGVLLARLISAGLTAAFLASAFLSCVQWRRSPLMTGALLVAATPMVLQLGGAVNPNSVEIAAGVSLAAAAIPLLLDTGSPHIRGWLRRAAIAAIALGQLRALGPLFIALLLLALLAPPVRDRLRQLARRRATLYWSAGVLVSCVVGLGWTVAFKAEALGSYARHQYSHTAIAGRLLTRDLASYFEQMVDGFSSFDTRPPAEIFMVWAMALGALLLAAFAAGSWTQRWRLGALVGVTVLIPMASDLATVNTLGYAFQSRYVMPIAVSVPLMAAYILGRNGMIPAPQQSALVRVMIILLLPFQLFSLGYVMDRWQSGLGPHHSLNPLHGSWHPVTGSALPLLMMTAGLCLLGALTWRASRSRGTPAMSRPMRPLMVTGNGHTAVAGSEATPESARAGETIPSGTRSGPLT